MLRLPGFRFLLFLCGFDFKIFSRAARFWIWCDRLFWYIFLNNLWNFFWLFFHLFNVNAGFFDWLSLNLNNLVRWYCLQGLGLLFNQILLRYNTILLIKVWYIVLAGLIRLWFLEIVPKEDKSVSNLLWERFIYIWADRHLLISSIVNFQELSWSRGLGWLSVDALAYI